jgi:hypothetical protein
MRNYVVVPPATVKRAAELSKWIDRAHAHAKLLPAKAGSAKRKTAKTKAATKRRVTKTK